MRPQLFELLRAELDADLKAIVDDTQAREAGTETLGMDNLTFQIAVIQLVRNSNYGLSSLAEFGCRL